MTQLKISNRIWIEKDGESFLGAGKVTLLEAIEKSGSINKASKSLGMSYKKAWAMINAMNKLSKEPMVIRESGGSGGGGTKVTKKGKEIIAEYNKLKIKCEEFLKNELADCSSIV